MTTITENENREKLKQVLLDIFLIAESEFTFDLTRAELDTWDSLGVVSLAVGIEETFGYHMTQEEALAIRSVADILNLLKSKGFEFDE
jgi:acyl carrier protein